MSWDGTTPSFIVTASQWSPQWASTTLESHRTPALPHPSLFSWHTESGLAMLQDQISEAQEQVWGLSEEVERRLGEVGEGWRHVLNHSI